MDDDFPIFEFGPGKRFETKADALTELERLRGARNDWFRLKAEAAEEQCKALEHRVMSLEGALLMVRDSLEGDTETPPAGVLAIIAAALACGRAK